MKRKRLFIIRFLTPAMLCFLFIFLYPAIRTFLMSFFKVGFVTDNMDSWQFVGMGNYVKLMESPLFKRSMENVLMIWLLEGVIVLALAMLLAVIITSGVKGKNFWRAVVYLPHVISAVALATMWLQYVFNNQYGFFKVLFEALHLNGLTAFQWTAPENLFLSMMIAYAFGSVGFYVLILAAGINGISEDYYEAARIEGAGIFQQWKSITVPLLKDMIKRCIVLYSAGAIGFFVYSTLFSFNTEMATVTPMVYMYEVVFGNAIGASSSELNVGAGAAVGVIIMILVVVVNTVLDKLVRSDDQD